MVPGDPLREEGGAVFPPRPLGRPARRPPLVAAILAIAVGGLVVIGALQPPVLTDPLASESARMAAMETPRETAVPMGTREMVPSAPASEAPAERIRLDARPDGRHLLVRGEVFSFRVFLVIVSIRGTDGETFDIRTLEVPGGGAAAEETAVNRFEVRFDLPDFETTRFVMVQASGYDQAGDRILSGEVRASTAKG